MRSIEIFTGAGGLALGTHHAKFQHCAVVERDHDSCDTLRLNRAKGVVEWPVNEADVSQFSYDQYLDQGVALVAGGAPCQPFSLGGKHAGEKDSRNMFPEVFRVVRELQPRAFLLENVKGLLRETFKPYFDYIVEQLAFPHVAKGTDEGWQEHKARLVEYHDAGEAVSCPPWNQHPHLCYGVKPTLVNVANYGIPQVRHRVFIVGFRKDLNMEWIFPPATHSEDSLLYAQYVDGSYWKEHGLKRREVPARYAQRVARLASIPKPELLRWRTVRDALRGLPEPVDYKPCKGFDNHVGIPDARSYPGHTGSPWDWPAKAIKAGDHGNPGGENMLRREDGTVRYFTVRELARLQTFPDNWHFANSWTEIRRQIGNAVPVEMAEIVASSVFRALEEWDKDFGKMRAGAREKKLLAGRLL